MNICAIIVLILDYLSKGGTLYMKRYIRLISLTLVLLLTLLVMGGSAGAVFCSMRSRPFMAVGLKKPAARSGTPARGAFRSKVCGICRFSDSRAVYAPRGPDMARKREF